MPWYKVEMDYGPGHQSHKICFEWADEELSEDQERMLFDACREEWWRGVKGTVEIVDELPVEERFRKLRSYRASIERAQRMIRILGEEP